MKRILGLDLGTNSIGWALVRTNFADKKGKIEGLGSRIIPMSQDVMGKFDSGVSISQTAERTGYRGVRRLFQRDLLRRERLHRVLNILDYLPQHYAKGIDFEQKLGQFKEDVEMKLNYRKNDEGKFEFIFMKSFEEMVEDFKKHQPDLFKVKHDGKTTKIPFDWTLYYLRKKALTEKISEQELAWIILNFNQKRGYYQLRGEEEDLPEDKKKEFCTLQVATVKDSGEVLKKTGDKLYNVLFENGWEYDKLVTKTENWIGKTKEYIVTSTVLKEGDIKRSFKEVNSEEDWIAIKEKTQQTIAQSGKTVGEYIYLTLLANPTQKIRGKLVKTIERKFYKDELRLILNEQMKHHTKLQDKTSYQKCVDELYPRNIAHQNNIKNNDFTYLFMDDIIFYQRPLKSKKSTISNCQYETRLFNKKVIDETTSKERLVWLNEPIKSIPKSHPLYQEFRIWQFIGNLKIYQKEDDKGSLLDMDITNTLLTKEEDWVELFEFINTKKELEQKHIIKHFIGKELIVKEQESNYRWNYVEDKKYPANETRYQFASRLKKLGIKTPTTFLSKKSTLGKKATLEVSLEEQLWHIIYSVKDKTEYEKAIASFADKHEIDQLSFVDAFRKFPPYSSDYGAYSAKALKKILPLMRLGSHWSKGSIDSATFNRINKLIDGEFDEKISDRVREKVSQLQSIEEYRGLPTWLAGYVVYNRHAESGDIQQWKSPKDIDTYLVNFKQHSLRNPIVEQVVTETLRTVKDIWQYYGDGKEGFFDEVHVELGREMKNSAENRKKLSTRVNENQRNNDRIKEVLKELKNSGVKASKPYSPSQQEILKIYEEGVYNNSPAEYKNIKIDEVEKIRKNATPSKTEIARYKLWLEQGYISPYTGKTIPLSGLFSTDYQIEHVIPQSRYFDDSLSNKIICESEVNQLKGNSTAYAFMREHGSEMVSLGQGKSVRVLSLEQYEGHCNKYFKANKSKLIKLLSEDIPEGFIERQLNDSRYISKLVKGLLGNVVREDNEVEATSKHIVPVTGAITAKLKQDWGLNDKWNELIAPRFQRLNELESKEGEPLSTRFGFWDNTINAFRTQVPDDIAKGFSKKRIDHRHHALDALVIACCTKKHTNYLMSLNAEKQNYSLRDSLLMKNKEGKYTKNLRAPWLEFTTDAKDSLEKIVVSFKQNLRVINKTNNKTWQWREKDGQLKKVLVKQEKGENWAIRKPMHKETVSGKLDVSASKGKIVTASRVNLAEIKTDKHLEKITDGSIRKILDNHVKYYLNDKGKVQFDLAFSVDGVEDLNKNIKTLNNGKNHQPIYKVRLSEEGSKFIVGNSGNKNTKYVEAAKGTNLFFVIYWDDKAKKRVYDTVPFNVVVEHQKQVAHLPKKERTPVPIDHTKGDFLFSLSPNDLVYVPTDEERDNPALVDKTELSKDQVNRVYKMVSCTGKECHFLPVSVSSLIKKYDSKTKLGEFGSLNKQEVAISKERIKDVAWKMNVDRLGIIRSLIK
jgi:CRISPR-associated endonuclease Csn1